MVQTKEGASRSGWLAFMKLAGQLWREGEVVGIHDNLPPEAAHKLDSLRSTLAARTKDVELAGASPAPG